MADVTISREAAEAGARALADWLHLDFDRIGDGQKTLRRQAEAVLKAAMPGLTDSLAQQIAGLREVTRKQQDQINALQAANTAPNGSAQDEANAIIAAWGPTFSARLDWELEFEADAKIAFEAWEQLVIQMATARAEQLRAQS